MTTNPVPPPFTTVIAKYLITVCWATISQIRSFMAPKDGEENYVYVGQAFTDNPRLPQVQIEAGIGNRLNSGKLDTYERRKVPGLLVVVIPGKAPTHSHLDIIRRSMNEYIVSTLANPEKAAQAARDAARELISVYRIICSLLEQINPRCELSSDVLDPELAGYIGQFAGNSSFLNQAMRLVFEKHGKSNKKLSDYDAFRNFPQADDAELRLGIKCGLEAVELQINLHPNRPLDVDAAAKAFFGGFYRRFSLWPGKELASFAIHSARLYEQLRKIVPSLPDIAALIREHIKVTAQTPFVYEIIIATSKDEGSCVLYRCHARPDATPEIRTELENAYIALSANLLPEITIRQINDDWAASLTGLSLAARFTSQYVHNVPAWLVIEELAREITTPYPEFDLDEELVAKPALYSQVLGAMARAHNVMPRGLVVMFMAPDPAARKVLRNTGFDGMIGASCGQELGRELWKGFFIFSHDKHRDRLLPEANREAITMIWMPIGEFLRRGFVPIRSLVDQNKLAHTGTSLYFLPDKVYRALLNRYRLELAPYLTPNHS